MQLLGDYPNLYLQMTLLTTGSTVLPEYSRFKLSGLLLLQQSGILGRHSTLAGAVGSTLGDLLFCSLFLPSAPSVSLGAYMTPTAQLLKLYLCLFLSVTGCGQFYLNTGFKLGSKVHIASLGIYEDLPVVRGGGNQIFGASI